MTLDDVLQELIQHMDSHGDGALAWEQVREWPEGAIKIFLNAGWIKSIEPAKIVECPGCEENCFMPVHVLPTAKGKPARAYVACDKRDDMGRIPIPMELRQQWQITDNQVAHWVAHTLGLKGKPKKEKKSGAIHIGNVQGKKKMGLLTWVGQSPVSLETSGHSISLSEVLYFKDYQIQIDQATIINMVDLPPTSERYKPSIARREIGKRNTQARHKGWQKAYREFKRTHPERSDSWCALQISRMLIGKSFSSETIRKNMKK